MSRTFKLALVVSLVVHLVAFATVRLTMRGGGSPAEPPRELSVVLMVPVQEDFIAQPAEVPPAPATPPPAPVIVPPKAETPPVMVKQPEPVVEPIKPAPTLVETKPAEPLPAKPAPISKPSPPPDTSPATNPVAVAVVAPVARPTTSTISSPAPATAAPVLITGRVKYRNAPDPEYPALSRRRRQEGTVLLEVVIAPGGRATEVRVKQSSSFPALDGAAVEAVRHWEFDVVTSVPVRAEIPVRFQLVK